MNRQLTLAVNGVEQQLADLQSRVDSLRGGVKLFAPHAYERAFGTQPQDANAVQTRSKPPADTLHPLPMDRRAADASFVQSLGESQAKDLLLVRSPN